jgi:GNAT superfamily N-acetyltransferase
LGEFGKQEIIFELASCRYIDFPLAILATAIPEKEKIMAGWVGFYTNHPARLATAIPNSMELRETKVDPAFFRNGLGSTLVQVALAVARDIGKVLYLKPERPGDGLGQKLRDENFPLSTELLRDFYLALGFRNLTDCERTSFTECLLERELTGELYTGGFNPRTNRFGKFVSYADPANPRYKAIFALSLTAKREALERFFEMKEYSNPHSLVAQRTTCAKQRTSGVLIARTDLELPKLMRGLVKTYTKQKPPPVTVQCHI